MADPREPTEPKMQRVPSADFVRKFSAYCDEALAEPIVLTRNGRDRLLVISVERYKHLLSLAILNAGPDAAPDDAVSELDGLIRRAGSGRD